MDGFTPPSRYQHRLADITKTLAETSTLTVYTSPKKSRLKKLRTAAGAVIRNIWEPLAMASAVSAGVSGELGWWWVGAMCVWLSSHLVYRRSAQKRREP